MRLGEQHCSASGSSPAYAAYAISSVLALLSSGSCAGGKPYSRTPSRCCMPSGRNGTTSSLNGQDSTSLNQIWTMPEYTSEIRYASMVVKKMYSATCQKDTGANGGPS